MRSALSAGMAVALLATSPVAGPVVVAQVSASGAVAVSVGSSQTCVLFEDGGLACWYWSDASVDPSGELLVSTYAPLELPALGTVAVGGAHACGKASADGSVWCWGSNALGQLGTRRSDGSTAARVPSSLSFVDVTAGSEHTCALTDDGAAWCWGDQWEGSTGTLPTGETVRDPAPVRGSRRFTQLSAGDRHTCGVTTGGVPACWGDNSTQAIRDDDWRTFFSPVDVGGIGEVEAVYSGSGMSCALRSDGTPVCWGRVVGRPSTRSGLEFVHLALATDAVCGVRPTGQVYCWQVEVSRDALAAEAVEVRLAGESILAESIDAAGGRVCAVAERGVLCWESSDPSIVRRTRFIATN